MVPRKARGGQLGDWARCRFTRAADSGMQRELDDGHAWRPPGRPPDHRTHHRASRRGWRRLAYTAFAGIRKWNDAARCTGLRLISRTDTTRLPCPRNARAVDSTPVRSVASPVPSTALRRSPRPRGGPPDIRLPPPRACRDAVAVSKIRRIPPAGDRSTVSSWPKDRRGCTVSRPSRPGSYPRFVRAGARPVSTGDGNDTYIQAASTQCAERRPKSTSHRSPTPTPS